jgi:hypothetical protein
MLRDMQAEVACPCCCHSEWVRENVVIVPGSCGLVRVVTQCQEGPADWTCATCGYVSTRGSGIGRALDLVPARSALRSQPSRDSPSGTAAPESGFGQ